MYTSLSGFIQILNYVNLSVYNNDCMYACMYVSMYVSMYIMYVCM